MLVPVSAYAVEDAAVAISGLGPDCAWPRTEPLSILPSSICVSRAIATLSGMFAEQMIMPAKPPRAVPVPASPVCTPIIPENALKGWLKPEPATKPERRRWSHQMRDSSVSVVLLYFPCTLPLPRSEAVGDCVAPLQRVVALGSSPGI